MHYSLTCFLCLTHTHTHTTITVAVKSFFFFPFRLFGNWKLLIYITWHLGVCVSVATNTTASITESCSATKLKRNPTNKHKTIEILLSSSRIESSESKYRTLNGLCLFCWVAVVAGWHNRPLTQPEHHHQQQQQRRNVQTKCNYCKTCWPHGPKWPLLSTIFPSLKSEFDSILIVRRLGNCISFALQTQIRSTGFASSSSLFWF